MLETFIVWVLIGTFIKIIYDNAYSKTRRRRSIKDQATDLFVFVAVIVILGLLVS